MTVLSDDFITFQISSPFSSSFSLSYNLISPTISCFVVVSQERLSLIFLFHFFSTSSKLKCKFEILILNFALPSSPSLKSVYELLPSFINISEFSATKDRAFFKKLLYVLTLAATGDGLGPKTSSNLSKACSPTFSRFFPIKESSNLT